MAAPASDDIRQSVADHLELEPDELVLVEEHDTTYTFRETTTGHTHTARVLVGPEGPVVTVDDRISRGTAAE